MQYFLFGHGMEEGGEDFAQAAKCDIECCVVSFRTIKGRECCEEVATAASALFSNHYGTWSGLDDHKRGDRIKLSPKRIRQVLELDGANIAVANIDGVHAGHAIYIRKLYEKIGVVTWVLQLVVHRDYRKKGLATRLLNSIWGFSGDVAWGLATVNPLTIKTLEKTTLRKCDPRSIGKRRGIIETARADIPFVAGAEIEVSNKVSLINTNFHIDISEFQDLYDAYGDRWTLGEIRPGWEWLAFTFNAQKPKLTRERFEELVMNTEGIIREAYSRMKIADQGWAKHSEKEVDWLTDFLGLNGGGRILDLGCGTGRHSIAFARKNFRCTAVDFSEVHLQQGKCAAASGLMLNMIEFVLGDVRNFQADSLYDVVLLLYDVIGSFPGNADNLSILRAAKKSVKSDGFIVASVMNMELTRSIALRTASSVEELYQEIANMPSSQTMQRTGNIFDPNYYLIDEESGLVYRKEQFVDDDQLASEYLIRDKRYTMIEICALFESEGLEIVDSRYVQAGKFETSLTATDRAAKEILVVARVRE